MSAPHTNADRRGRVRAIVASMVVVAAVVAGIASIGLPGGYGGQIGRQLAVFAVVKFDRLDDALQVLDAALVQPRLPLLARQADAGDAGHDGGHHDHAGDDRHYAPAPVRVRVRRAHPSRSSRRSSPR